MLITISYTLSRDTTAIPSSDQIETLRRAVRYLIAAEQIKTKVRQLNLTDEQRGQLRERESTEQSAAEAALLKLYMEVWLPRVEGGELSFEQVAVGGRPLQTTLNPKKQAMIHERLVELITAVQPRVFSSLTPAKLVEIFKLGEGQPPTLGIRTKEVVDGLYSFLGFPRLTNSAVIRRTLARGVLEGVFGYTAGATPSLGADGTYQVAHAKVRCDTAVLDDEIDLESGFLILPQAISQPTPMPVSLPPTSSPSSESMPVPSPTPSGFVPLPARPAAETAVELVFTADRNQLYTAWNAIANLADLAGKVTIIVRAESVEGLDQSRLQNGVFEPLREADLLE